MRKKITLTMFISIFCAIFSNSLVYAGGVGFRTTQELYRSCDLAIENESFDDTYCAGFINGYFSGFSTYGLYLQRELTEEQRIHIKKRAALRTDFFCLPDKNIPTLEMATLFVEAIENNKSSERLLIAMHADSVIGFNAALNIIFPCQDTK